MKKISWNPNQDKDVRQLSIGLQSHLHENYYLKMVKSERGAREFLASPRTAWRRRLLDKFELFLGKPISGKIIEIGAGTGWCTTLLSKKPSVQEVYALEYDPVSVNGLIQATVKSLKGNSDKITLVHGSFNDMPLENEFDFVVSIGALHHSENLRKTFSECFKVLKPNGWFIVTEPCEPNSKKNIELHKIYNNNATQGWQKAGKAHRYKNPVKWKDTSNHWYRLCEYEAHAHNAGFDVYPYIFEPGGRPGNDDIFTNRVCYDGLQCIVYHPYFAVRPKICDRLCLFLQKPANPIPSHGNGPSYP